MSIGLFVAILVALVAFFAALGALHFGENAIWWSIFALAVALIVSPIEIPAFWRTPPPPPR
jgi:hypothetical protein